MAASLSLTPSINDSSLRGYPIDEKSPFYDCSSTFRMVRVRIQSAEGLAKKDLFGFSDPYVTCELKQNSSGHVVDSVKTKTIKKTLNPVWKEEWIFRVSNTFRHHLALHVFDENRVTRDDFLGQVEIKLDSKIPTERKWTTISEKSYSLNKRSSKSKVKGKILVYIAYVPVEPSNSSPTPRASSSPRPTDFSGLESIEGSDSAVSFEDVEQIEATPSLNMDDVERVGHDMEDFMAHLSLPPGWEERQDGNGRTYYVNHATRRTQFDHPQLMLAVGGEDTEGSIRQRRQHISVEEQVENGDNVAQVTDEVIDQLSSTATNGDSAESSPSEPENVERDQRKLDRQSSAGPMPDGWAKKKAPNGRLFFINHKDKSTTWVDPRTGKESPMPSGSKRRPRQKSIYEDVLGPLPPGWEERVHKDGRTFFIDHNNKKTQWDDPRLYNPEVAGSAVPYNRNYKLKYDSLKASLPKPPNHPRDFQCRVRRRHIFEDSFRAIQMPSKQAPVLRCKLNIEFDHEKGLDYGGVSREWFYLLSKEMFNPYYGFFEYSAMDNYTLQINPLSGECNEMHLMYFKFFGRVAAMAVYHGKLLDAFFIRPFYKMMLDKPMNLQDMESVDAEYYNSLQWIKENDPADLDLSFQVEEEKFGTTSTTELIPDGGNVVVTEENKMQYIDLIINHRFVSRVSEQMAAFKEGFNEVVPLHLIKRFDEGELELLLGGIGSIDVLDWKHNTEYKGDYHENHKVIQWFWRLVLCYDNEMRSRLLQFVTGTSRVPMNGFKELYGSNGPKRFTIERWGTPDNFPRAHTCFNRIDLPPYTSFEQLKEKITGAIEGAEGFAGVD